MLLFLHYTKHSFVDVYADDSGARTRRKGRNGKAAIDICQFLFGSVNNHCLKRACFSVCSLCNWFALIISLFVSDSYRKTLNGTLLVTCSPTKQRMSLVCVLVLSEIHLSPIVSGMRTFSVHIITTSSHSLAGALEDFLTINGVFSLAIQNIHVVETVDSLKLAKQLQKQWTKHNRDHPLNIFVQVNTSGEECMESTASFFLNMDFVQCNAFVVFCFCSCCWIIFDRFDTQCCSISLSSKEWGRSFCCSRTGEENRCRGTEPQDSWINDYRRVHCEWRSTRL